MKQMFRSFFIYINLISILYQSYIALQLPFVGCFYFVDFQMFKLSNLIRPKKILNNLTTININNLHHTKINRKFVS